MASERNRTVLRGVAATVLSFGIVAAAACARNAASAPPESGPVAGNGLAAVARAAGEQVRREQRSLVVFPTFLDRTGDPPTSWDANRAAERELLDAFRAGANAQYADTAAYADSARRATLSDSARSFVTLGDAPDIRGDSAFVDVYSGRALVSDGPVERSVFRYAFVRMANQWRFVGRSLVYAA